MVHFSYQFAKLYFTPCLWTVALKDQADTWVVMKSKVCLFCFCFILTYLRWNGALCHFSVTFLLVNKGSNHHYTFILLVKDLFFHPENSEFQVMDTIACQHGKSQACQPRIVSSLCSPGTVAKLRLVEMNSFLKPLLFAFTFCCLLSSVCKLRQNSLFYQNHVASMGTSLALIACACDILNVCKLAGLLLRS